MSKESMKLALEALDDRLSLMKWQAAREALHQAIAEAERQEQVELVIDKSAAIRIATALGWTPPKQEQGEPTRHELQAKGKHPAPCARFCEANAFEIEIKNLKGDIERAILAEREACLKICEEQAVTAYWEGADVCVEEIKKRGLKL
jgi:hypothetical protein